MDMEEKNIEEESNTLKLTDELDDSNKLDTDLSELQVNEDNANTTCTISPNTINDDCKLTKRDDALDVRDELDFEEQKESGEESDEEEPPPIIVETIEPEDKEPEEINREEGELSDDDEDESLLRQEPKTVCRFFNKGQCTWGTNCRFLHPGVSDKGNYNMFAPSKPSLNEDEPQSPEKEKPSEVRRYVPEVTGFETAWERGLRHAKEMKKRANKRKETDADFEEKRFNLSLGQAELDRENDYYTRPASPAYKPPDEAIELLDSYEKQAIRHFRGGHFENLEVRYNTIRPEQQIRSRRDKFDREVSDRIPRKMRPSPLPETTKPVKERRYPKVPRGYKEEKGEAELWADPWARRKTPLTRKRTHSYSSGSSSRSSHSSRSSSYSSYTSRSRSSSGSRSTSRSRSITPPVHPRQRAAALNRGGGRAGIQQRLQPNSNQMSGPNAPSMRQNPNFPPNHSLGPSLQRPIKGSPVVQVKQEPNKKYPQEDRVDMFGRTIRKEVPSSPKKKLGSKSPVRRKGSRRKYSVGSKSGSGLSSISSRSGSHGRSSSSGSSVVSTTSPVRHKNKTEKKKVEKSKRLPAKGAAETVKAKAMEVVKLTSQKQVRMTIKKPVRPSEKTVLENDDDSGESDTDTRIPKKRKPEASPISLPVAKIAKLAAAASKEKKPSAARREELLKQLRAVEDAIAKKRSKPVE